MADIYSQLLQTLQNRPTAPNPNIPVNNPAGAVSNMQRRIESTGRTAPAYSRPLSALMWTLELMERPRYAIANVARDLTDADPTNNRIQDLGRTIVEGLAARDKGSFRDVMQNLGVENKRALGIGGFVGDILLNPITYMSLGKSAGGKALGRLGSKTDDAARALGYKGKIGDDIAKVLAEVPGESLSGQAISRGVSKLQAGVEPVREAARLATKTRAGTLGWVLPGWKTASLKMGDNATQQIWDSLQRAVSLSGQTDIDENALRTVALNALGELDKPTQAVINKMNRQQLSILLELSDTFGADISVKSLAKSAERIGGAKGTKYLGSLAQKLQVEDAARTALGEAEKSIEFASGIRATFDALQNTYSLSFMGRPIKHFAREQKLASKAFDLAYDNNAVVRNVYETVQKLWGVPQHINREAKKLFPILAQAENLITAGMRRENAIPRVAANQAVLYLEDLADDTTKALSQKIITNHRLREFVPFFIEQNKTSTARRKWESIAATLAPDELEIVEFGARRAREAFQAMALSEGLEVTGDIVDDYVLHLLQREKNQQLLTIQQKRAAAAYATDKRVVRSQAERLTEALSPRHKSQLERTPGLETLADAMEHGFVPQTTDILDLLAIRSARGRTAELHKELVKGFSQIPGLLETKETRAKMLGYVRIPSNVPGLAGHYAHPELVRHLQRMDSIFFTDQAASELGRWVDLITNQIKTLQTTANPAFIMRNFVGENLMTFIDAKNPVNSTLKAFQLLNDPGAEVQIGKLTQTGRNFIPGVFEKLGLGHSGITKGEYAKRMADLTDEAARAASYAVPIRAKTVGSKLTRPGKWYMDRMRDAGDSIETVTRLAHFIDKIDQGLTIEDAADAVRMFHVDYRDITKFEANVMRRLIPYYTFMRKNTPIQLRLAASAPAYPLALAQLQRASLAAIQNPELTDHLSRNLAIPLWEEPDGTIQFMNWNLPIIDLARLSVNDFQGNLRDTISMLNPLIKAPIEWAANQTLGTGAPIERYSGERVPLLPNLEGSPQIPAHLAYGLSQLGAVNTARQAAGLWTDRQAESEQFGQATQIPILSSLLPRRTRQQMQAAADFAYRDQLSDYMKRETAQGAVFPTINDIERPERLRKQLMQVLWSGGTANFPTSAKRALGDLSTRR